MASDVTAATGIERVLEHPLAVEPRAIEDEFTRIWKETAGAGFDESSIRLRVLNFVGIGLNEDARERFDMVMEALPERHPCRGIMAMTSLAQSTVTASISAHCWRTDNGARHLCSEEVLLQAAPGQERALASAVLALLVPELQVTVWLVGNVGLEDAIATEIIGSADRVFIDSAGAIDARAVMQAAVRAHAGHQVEVSDLAWCRLGTWRGLIAQLFDSAAGARELAGLTKIEIGCGGFQLCSEALLLAGWFVSRLGLSLADLTQSEAELDATLYDGSRGVSVRIRASGEGTLPVILVRITTQGAAFSVELHEESGHIHVLEEWPNAPVRRTVEQLPEDDASVLAEAIDDADGPAIYLEALQGALALMGEQDATGSSSPRP